MAALMGAMEEGGGEMMPPEMEASSGPAEAVTSALSLLEPFMDDPRIAQAAMMLQEVAAGPAEMSADSESAEAAGPMPY